MFSEWSCFSAVDEAVDIISSRSLYGRSVDLRATLRRCDRLIDGEKKFRSNYSRMILYLNLPVERRRPTII